MSHRVYDHDRTPDNPGDHVRMAQQRASRFADPLDQARFMDAFRISRIAASKGADIYVAYRHRLEADDSVWVAGHIEGLASVSGPEKKIRRGF